MEKVVYSNPNNYTFDDWINGVPEPDLLPLTNQIITNDNGIKELKKNPVITEIMDAKRFTFDKSIDFILQSKKSVLDDVLSNLDLSEKTEFTNAEIEKAKEYYSKFPIQDLITQTNKSKLDNISGSVYLKIKRITEELNSGKIMLSSIIPINHFHEAIIYYEYSKYCNMLLGATFNIAKEKLEKGETVFVRYALLNEFFESKTVFYQLNDKMKNKLLGVIFSCDMDTAKKIKNRWPNSAKPDGKNITETGIERFTDLLDKIKKGEFL